VQLCGGVEVEADRRALSDALFGGRQGRLVFAFLVCERHRAVRREELADLLWPEQLPDSWSASLSAVVSRLRRLLTEAGLEGTSALVSAAGSYQLILPPDATVDIEQLAAAVAEAETTADAGDVERAVQAASAAEHVAARGFLTDDCDWVDQWRERVHDLRVRAALARSVAHLAAGSSGRAVDAARDALALDPSREAAFRQVMRALAAAGERGEALRVWERCRITLVEELGVDPAPETEAVYLEILGAGAAVPGQVVQSLPSGVVTFLLTDIVESSAMWEEHATAMAAALERHDAIVGDVVTAHGGTLLKSKLEGDATVSVFARATEGANAALALLGALASEPWPAGKEPRVRMAMHTGEAFERGGDYFGPALNRAARLRSLADASEVLLSQAVAELVRDHLPAGVELRDRGHRDLRGLSRGENVYQLAHAQDPIAADAPAEPSELTRPPVPAALTGGGPFVGRGNELARLTDLWDRSVAATSSTAFIGGEPGVGKSRLAGEVAAHAHAAGALVLYGRCDEDLAVPLQPFIEAVRTLVPSLGAARLQTVRGVDELRRFVPELGEVLFAPGIRADPDTERLALFDAVTQLMRAASAEAPVLLVLDDLHWAGKTTLSLLRHLLREAKGARLLIVGTYRDTELARTHPLAATLADVRRDADAHRITLSGLAAADVEAYVAAIGNTDRALGRELAEVTSGNPFFLIEVLRHIEEAGGAWEPGTLPEGVREATGRRLSRLSDAANETLAIAAVVGTTFDLALVEQVRGTDLIDPIAEACRAGLVVEEPGALARFRFAHALVRQVLLAELVTRKRGSLHRTIAELLEAAPATGDPDARLADLAYHWFECASTGSANKAVEACRRAGDRAMERLAYEEAGDLYAMALQALDAVDEVDPDETAALHLARCDALLTAGDVGAARGAIDALELAARGSERLAAWYTTYEGLLAVLAEPDRLTEIVQSIGAAAGAMRAVGDLRGEAKAHYVYAAALERLGQIGAAERALDAALAAARNAGDPRLANTILAEAPPAALWGPSPVTRASGRCLDVVRVLRITAGAPAVESVALRCQAVLEALRGRVDPARRMIGSARRSVEQLGLTHRRLETEVMAGFIELLDGKAGAAEIHLREAYEELRARGLGGEAAQAGAFLGRALLMQGRVDEADDVAAEAERLAGADLKAGIAWRDVRAEAAARRGDTARALALAREAVELASATDALLLVADARRTLAGVLRAVGDTDAADAEAQRAVDACEAKGATVLAARARAGMRAAPLLEPVAERIAAPDHDAPTGNLAFEWCVGFHDAFNRADWDTIRASMAPTFTRDDRRHYVAMIVGLEDRVSEQFSYERGGRWERPELIATRGDQLALCRWLMRAPDWESLHLAVIGVDGQGRVIDYVLFEPEAIEEATAALDRLASETARERVFENDVTRTIARVHAGYRTRDWEAIENSYAEDWKQDDRRSVVSMPLNHEQSMAGARMIFDGGGWLDRKTIATRGRSLAAGISTLHIPAHGVITAVLMVTRTDDAGRQQLTILYDVDDVDPALAELDRLYQEGEGAAHADAFALAMSFVGALGRGDVAAAAALAEPDFVVRDHRLVAAPPQSTAEWVRSLQDSIDRLDDGGRVRLEHVLRLSEHGCVFSYVHEGAVSGGVGFEVRVVIALRVRDGRLVSLDSYDEDDVDAACAALDAPGASFAAERFANAAWRAVVRLQQAQEDRSWQAFLDALAPGFEVHENRPGTRIDARGDAALDMHRVLYSLDDWTVERSLLATRGDRLALVEERTWFVDGAAGESEILSLSIVECDTSGLVVAIFTFDIDDLDSAYDALDARYVELGGPELRPYGHAFGSRDWDRYASFFKDDASIEDRRRAGDGSLDRDRFDAYQRAIPDLAADATVRFDHVDAASPNRSLIVGRIVGTRDGGPFEMPFVSLALTDANGRISAMTLYDIDDLDTARAEYARLTTPSLDDRTDSSASSVAEHFANAAWRTVLRLREAEEARSWQAFLDAVAPGFQSHERRTTIHVDARGDAALDVYRLLFSLDDWTVDLSLLATRGDRLALTEGRVWFVGGAAGDSEVLTLSIIEVDANGLMVATFAFDIDDLEGAYDELDARYVALGGPDLRPYRHAFDARDWERYARFFEDDASFEDRRPVGYGRMDRDGFVAYQQATVEVAPDATLHIDHVDATSPTASLMVGRKAGTRDGGAFEVPSVVLTRTAPSGRIAAMTVYALDDLDTARADYARLTAPSLDDHFPNLAWRAIRAHVDAVNTGDWNAFAATLAPDLEDDDRRSMVARVTRGDEARAVSRTMFALEECRLDRVLLATRGDRLALVRTTATFRDGAVGPAESTGLNVYQVDEAGFVTHHVSFDPDDMTAAFDELDARFAALGGSPFMSTMRHAFDARDWDTFASVFTEDCTIVDSRTAGWGSVDREVFVDYQRSVADLADVVHLWVAHARERGNVGISTGRAFGTRAGGNWEIAFVTVGVMDAEGRTRHFETYELGDMAIALARFHELVAAENAESSANAAWRALRAQERAVNEHSWEAFAATLAPDFEHDDRRIMLGRVDGPDAFALVRTIFDFDDVRLEETLLATRGDRLALVRTTVTFRYGVELTPAEFVCLDINQVNEHGLVTHMVLFDDNDVQAAHDELEARYLALSESRPRPNRAWESVERAIHAFDERDRDRFSACFHPDAILEERRRGFSIYLTGDAAISSARVMFDMAEATWRCRLVASAGECVALVQYDIWGTDGVVGEIEVKTLTVVEIDDDGRIVRQVSFDVDEHDKAEAEMHALVASTSDPLAIPRNRAVRSVEQPGWTLLAAVVDDLCLHATADGLVLHQVDASGTIIAKMEFAAGERRAASDEITRRFSEEYGIVGGAAQLSKAMNARDLATVRGCMADSFVIDDRRHLRVADLQDADSHIAMLASAFDLVQDYLVEAVRVDAVEPWGSVGLTRNTGTTTDSGPFETLAVALTMWDDDGLITRIEVYDPEDANAAVERLRALGP